MVSAKRLLPKITVFAGNMNTESIIGLIASVFTGVSLLPQLIKLIRNKEAKDISIIMLIILMTGLGLWVFYGILKEDWIIIISNAFSLVINFLVMIFSVKYKKH